MTNTTIPATTAHDDRRACLTFHKPGCGHLRSLQVLSTTDRDIEDLLVFQAEAVELNQPNPIAPCLRKDLKAAGR